MTSETLVSQPLDFGKFFGLAGPLFFANHSHGSWNPLVLVAYHSNTFISTWFGDPLPIIPIPSKSRQALPSARPASGRCLRRSATRRAVALPRLGEALATPSPEDGDGGWVGPLGPHFPAHVDGLKWKQPGNLGVCILGSCWIYSVWAHGNCLKIGDGIIEVVVRNQHQWVRKPTQQCFDIMLVRR